VIVGNKTPVAVATVKLVATLVMLDASVVAALLVKDIFAI
jgi:hypothetical protein